MTTTKTAMIYSPREYWRITVNIGNGKQRRFWATNLQRISDQFVFYVVNRDGDQTDHIVAGKGDDMASIEKARLNLFFGTMELA